MNDSARIGALRTFHLKAKLFIYLNFVFLHPTKQFIMETIDKFSKFCNIMSFRILSTS